MKLLVLLSVIACSYAAKLDRTYLPPASASSAGGSPGSLSTPVGPSGPSTFGQPNAAIKSNPAFGNGFQAPSPQYGQPVGSNVDSAFGQPSQAFGNQGLGGQVQGFGNQASNFGNQASTFGNQAQDYQRNQPERVRASEDRNAQILRSDSQNDGETFSYSFETSNGIAAEESGVATNGVQAQGSFSYSDDDGQSFRIVYTADENGYQPQGDHLPTPPPIPDEILKSIEENARAAAAGTQEGAYNPEEDNLPTSGVNQYNANAPTSYNQAPTGPSGAFNQPGKAAELYSAPNSGARPQGFQGNTQGPSQQYGAPSFQSGASAFNQAQSQSPSKLYNAPSPNAAKPFNQNQGPSGFKSSNNFGATGSSANQARPNQYQAPSNQFGRPQAQSQDDSGYQYDRPQQGSSFGRDSARPSQFTPQTAAQQGFGPSTSNQGSFAPNNGAQQPRPQSFGQSQGSFGPASNPSKPFAPSGPSAKGSSPSSYPKGNFGSNTQSSFGSAQSFGSPNGPSSFNPSAGQSFEKPQGQSQAAGMSDNGYQYNRPSSQGQGPQGGFGGAQPSFNGAQGGINGAQSGIKGAQGYNAVPNAFKPSPQQGGQAFGGPRQPPSFNEQEGYKY